MANRRKFLAGLGALASGSAAAVGTGAFTSVQAQRAVDVSVATDANSYLSLQATGDRATTDSNNQLKIDLASSNNGSQGLNPDARSAFTDIFTIKNQGDNDVLIAVGTEADSVYVNGDSQSNSSPHIADTSGVSTFVYDEENGSGPGLGPTADNFTMGIDSGGRVDLDKKFDSATFQDSDRLVTPGESVSVDLTVITEDTIGGGSGIPDSNKKITVMAVEPNSDRSDGGNGS
jgi:hypothetical protein